MREVHKRIAPVVFRPADAMHERAVRCFLENVRCSLTSLVKKLVRVLGFVVESILLRVESTELAQREVVPRYDFRLRRKGGFFGA